MMRAGTERSLQLLVLALLLTAALYAPGLDSPFLFDDRQNIVENPYVQPQQLNLHAVQQALAAFGGSIGRPVSTLSFAINYYLTGLDPFSFKLVNLYLHLFTGLGIFGLVRRLIEAQNITRPLDPQIVRWLPLLCATLWLVHPLHVSTVLYAVQRMAILSTLFVVLGLWAYCAARLRQIHNPGWATELLLLSALMLALATLSKENGALQILLCGLAEVVFFRGRAADQRLARLWKYAWILAALVISAAVILGFDWLTRAYTTRDFTLEQRLLTQLRVLCYYLQLLIIPSYGEMALYHDDFAVSTGWLSPWTTAAAGAALLLLIAAAAELARRGHRLAAFGIGFYFVSHLMESTIIPLEMIFEHRNYLAGIGVMLLLGLAALSVAQPRYRRGMIAGLALFLAACSALTLARAQLFTHPLHLVEHGLRHHPGSLRTQLWAGDIYRVLIDHAEDVEQKHELIERARPFFRTAAKIDVGDVLGLLQLMEFDAAQGKPFNAGDYADLAQRLHQKAVRPGTVLGMQEFLTQIADGQVQFPPESALHLADLLLENPSCIGRYRAFIQNGAAMVALNSLGRGDEALHRSRDAMAAQPHDPVIRLNAAIILMRTGHLEQAESVVLETLDLHDGPFRPGLERLLTDIRIQRSRS